MVRLIPRDGKFFEMFSEMAANLTDGARVLVKLLNSSSPQDIKTGHRRIKDIEHQGDEMTHNVVRTLNQTFITPFDREDIHRLASSIDDVLDFINAAGERLVLYKIENPPPPAAKLAVLIVRQSEELTKALALLKTTKGVLEHCVEINRLEDEADQICRVAIAELFENEKDPITLIKFKELYEVLETATDKAEDAANVLEGVVLKSA
jgi:predicted phosphate transport protein (TIGR00153 family)